MHPQSGHRRASRRNPSPDVATLSPICPSRRPQPSEHTRLAMSALGEMRPRRCEQRIRCCSAVAAIGGEGTSFRLGRYHFNGLIKSGRGTWPIDSAATCFGKVRTPRDGGRNGTNPTSQALWAVCARPRGPLDPGTPFKRGRRESAVERDLDRCCRRWGPHG